MGRFGDWAPLLLLALCLVAPTTMANQIISVGGRTNLSNGFIDLACTDLTIGGVLDTGTGTYANVHNVTVAQSGAIQGAGSIKYSGTLSVHGTVQGSVKLIVNPPSNAACPRSADFGRRWQSGSHSHAHTCAGKFNPCYAGSVAVVAGSFDSAQAGRAGAP